MILRWLKWLTSNVAKKFFLETTMLETDKDLETFSFQKEEKDHTTNCDFIHF